MNKIELERVLNDVGTVQKTAKHFGCSYCKIKYWLEKYGILFKLENNVEQINEEELAFVYNKMQSIRKVGKHFNISHEKARYLLNKYNLCNKLVRYNCNHDLFSHDTQCSFYWAGFLAADGCILDKKGPTKIISLGLAQKDKDVVLAFKDALNAENPIKDYLIKNSKRNPKWNDSWKSEIKITSNKLCKDLQRFNVVPRKSKTYTFPEWLIKHELTNHFMRGYADGDGSFFFNTKKNRITKQLYFSLRGTSEFLTTYRIVLERECDLTERENPIRINNDIGVLEYGGNNVVGNIVRFLYKDADICLERKRNIIQDIL